MSLGTQVVWLFLLALPVACISWTITHENIFKEVHDYCVERSRSCQTLFRRKLFYVLTCEFCLSHYVTAAVLAVVRYTLLLPGWRGYLIAGFSLVWIANLYMSIFGRLRLEIKGRRIEIEHEENPFAEEIHDVRA